MIPLPLYQVKHSSSSTTKHIAAVFPMLLRSDDGNDHVWMMCPTSYTGEAFHHDVYASDLAGFPVMVLAPTLHAPRKHLMLTQEHEQGITLCLASTSACAKSPCEKRHAVAAGPVPAAIALPPPPKTRPALLGVLDELPGTPKLLPSPQSLEGTGQGEKGSLAGLAQRASPAQIHVGLPVKLACSM